MIFDDKFYPGNPARRRKVEDLRADMRSSFRQYKNVWNEFADLLNGAFSKSKEEKFSKIRVGKLVKDIEKDTIGACVNEINDVVGNAHDTLVKLVGDIGLSALLPKDWEKKGVKVDDIDYNAWIAKGVFGGVSALLGGFMAYYVITGVTVAATIVAAAAQTVVSVGAIIGGVVGGIILGGAVFVISDLVGSAITGAIERKKLNEAIDVLTEMKAQVTDPMDDSRDKISGILNNIKRGSYQLDDTHFLWRKEDGSYVVVKFEPTSSDALDGADAADANDAICERLIMQGQYKVLIPAPAA